MTITYHHAIVGGSAGTPAVAFGNDLPLVLIAGPCQIESLDHAVRTATAIAAIADLVGISFVYQSSYDKANRTSMHSPRGVGMTEGLRILEAVRERVGCPVTTDVHTAEEAYSVSMAVDLVQIPAMLSRQTDLLRAAGHYSKAVSVKKMQTMAAEEMLHAVVKVKGGGLVEPTILIERGSMWGPGRLVNDMAGLEVMKAFGPVVFDATHSVQLPGGGGISSVSGGMRRHVPVLARAAVAVGIAGVFLEVHEDPDNAPSDGPCMLPIKDLAGLLVKLKDIDEAVKG
jgi:2-dehydro-3-deoxyphosphooctonate aldolase (KDO 8-P synthase)